MHGKSSVASASTITVAIPSNYLKSHEISPNNVVETKKLGDKIYKIIDLQGYSSFPLNLQFSGEIEGPEKRVYNHLKDQIILSRHFTGYGQEKGGVKVSVINSYEKSIKGLYLEVLPWYMRYYFHSLADSQGISLLDRKKNH